MAERKGLSKKVRFEVFKRDSFKCQYCGESAPDVVLEVDHIVPVSKGGENDTSNLITACKDCNRGKSNIELDDDSTISKQKEQLDELNERRNQLEMMIQWRQELKSMDDDIINQLIEEFEELANCVVNDSGKKNLKKWLKKYSYGELSEAIEKSVSQYQDIEIAFNKIPSIAYWEKNPKNEEMRHLYYIRGIMKNRFNYLDENMAIVALKKAKENGANFDDLKELALVASNWTDWKERMEKEGYPIEY